MKKILCWLLAFLLTCTLALFGFSYVAARAVDPALKEGGTPVDGFVQKLELQLIRNKIDKLAPIYQFSADTAKKYVTAEKVAEMNDQAARWWSRVLDQREGRGGRLNGYRRKAGGDFWRTRSGQAAVKKAPGGSGINVRQMPRRGAPRASFAWCCPCVSR